MNLQILPDKSIAKLIDVVSKGIGTIYRPKAIRAEAEAQADAIRTIAKARADEMLIKDEASEEIVKRAKQRFINQEIKRQTNLEDIAAKAEDHLDEDVSEKPVNDDWITTFFNFAQDISDAQMQDLWARILAGEIKNPGSYSLRALQQIKFMSHDEAILFSKICELAFDDGFIVTLNEKVFKKYLTVEELIKLESIGLINYNPITNLTLTYQVNKDGFLIIKNNNLNIAIKPLDTNSETVDFTGFVITSIGKELRKLVEVSANINYLKDIVEEYKARYAISEAINLRKENEMYKCEFRPFDQI